MLNPEVKQQQFRAEAAAWLARLRSDELTEAEKAAFQTWLRHDADHGAAFEAVNGAWESIGAVERDLRGYRTPVSAGISRRQILAGAGLLLFSTGGIAYWQSAEADVYQTEIGEQRHIVLGNGCQVFLDTDTRLVVRRASAFSVLLERGCANFRVMTNDGRPFTIDTGAQNIVTSRASMDVRRDGEQISVFVIEGEAAISRSLDYEVRRLEAGDRITIGGSNSPVADRPEPTRLLAWHNGQAFFRDDRLADAVAEMNRYSIIKVTTDPGAGNERISGVFSVGDNLAFANSLTKFLPVRVRYSDNHIEVSRNE